LTPATFHATKWTGPKENGRGDENGRTVFGEELFLCESDFNKEHRVRIYALSSTLHKSIFSLSRPNKEVRLKVPDHGPSEKTSPNRPSYSMNFILKKIVLLFGFVNVVGTEFLREFRKCNCYAPNPIIQDQNL
jgi:hypothetical protein